MGEYLNFKYRHKASAKIVYDPHRGAMKARTLWWCVAEVDREITRYYRWWLQRERHVILQKPAWDAHISVIRGEKPRDQQLALWRKYQGKRIEFEYEHGNIRRVPDKDAPGDFYWIDVECEQLSKIREEFGFPVKWKYHITIGRTYY